LLRPSRVLNHKGFMLIEFIRKKLEKEKAENHRRFEKAWQDFHQITALMIEKYKPIRIYQWGSLLNEQHFSAISDIDVAVEGITDAQTYFEMIGEADEMTDVPLDIVQLEKIDPIHAQSIRTKGKLIYERI
jgi:predicted nucleotidyltransferase